MAKTIEFYDLKKKEHFTTSNYTIKTRIVNGVKRKFAVASKTNKRPYEAWRALPKNFKK